ncbi:MAG: response regulator transcription factor [Schwartzia sp.]|nr:response regulator transcription factor [Schwartzia sp. (in: firmicutes)]
MRIAIVDDSREDLDLTESYLRDHIRENYPRVEAELSVDTFTDPEEFLTDFRVGQYDLIILDIYMTFVNGIQTARIVRSRDRDVSIVFLTSSKEHILEGYRVFAVGYFIKPLAEHEREFAKTLAHIFPTLLERETSLDVPVGNSGLSVPYRTILYLDIDPASHRVLVHLVNGESLDTGLIYAKCREALLADRRFLECHHRVIVNMDYIASMGKTDFLLDGGTVIPISQRKHRETKAAYMRYLAHR